jgi:hypothetical protein
MGHRPRNWLLLDPEFGAGWHQARGPELRIWHGVPVTVSAF